MSTKTPITKVLFRHTQKMIWVCLVLVFGIGVFATNFWQPETALAATNTTMNFQARLLQSNGALTADGFYNVQFKLYYGSSGGSALWTETYYDSDGGTPGNDNRVRVANGYLTVNLGALDAFPGTIDWDQDLYLTMNVGGTAQTATPTWDGEMNPRLKITAVPYAFKAAQSASVASAATNAASTNSNLVSILSGNALGATSNSGNIQIDAGTATGTAGVIQIGTTNASAVTLGRAGITSTLQGTISLTGAGTALQVVNNATIGGTLGVTGLSTLTGGATIGASTLFTNNGATLNGTYAIGDLPTGGNIGTAAATVDVYTNFTVTQTTAGQTLTIPAPTSTTTGRLIYVTNVGSAGYTISGNVASPGTTMAFVWNNTTSAWTLVSSGTSGNYIQNGTAVQTASMNIQSNSTTDVTAVFNGANGQTANILQVKTGTGTTALAVTSGGAVLVAGTIDMTTSNPLNIGTTNATQINLNKNVVVAANQSLTISGGTTRPVAPTEGMVYFESDTFQLLTYANGKWQADRTDAIIVAASNSSQADKDAADYVADGNTAAANDGDQIQINAALTAASGKKVVLLAGTYTIDASISIPNNTTLAGVGMGTLITIPDALNTNFNAIVNTDQTTGTNVTIRDLGLDGNKANQAGGVSMSGTKFNNMGGGSGASARRGVSINNIQSNNWYYSAYSDCGGAGICLWYSANSTVIDNTTQSNYMGIYVVDTPNTTISNNSVLNNSSRGIYLSSSSDNSITSNIIRENNRGINISFSSNNAINDNTVDANTDGIYISFSSNNSISGNAVQSNTSRGIYLETTCSYNTISNNTTQGNSLGISIYRSSNNTISGNTVKGNSTRGISISDATSNSNNVTGNKLHDNGGLTDNNAVYLSVSDSNTIIGNDITDTSATTSNYAINISDNTSDNNYLADNRFSSTPGTATINDAGTGTVFANQPMAENGMSLLNRTLNSATAFTIQGTNKVNIFNVDSTNGEIEVGSYNSGTNPVAGKLVVANAGNANTITLQSVASPTASRTISLPDEDGTVCLQNSANCGFALASGSGSYVQFAPASAQADATNNSSIFINKTSGTGNILQLQKAGVVDVFTISNTGTATFQNSEDSTTGFQVLDQDGGISILSIDTVNERVSIGGVATTAALTVVGPATGTHLFVGNTSAIDSGTGIRVNADNISSGRGISISGSNGGEVNAIGAAGALLAIDPIKDYGNGSTKTESGNFIYVNRRNTVTNVAGTFNTTGDLALLQSSNCSGATGTCTDSGKILNLQQNFTGATGTVLNVGGVGTGNLAVFDATNASANGISIDVQSSGSSQYALNVTANNGATSALYVRADGNVGIGTSSPANKLSVNNLTTTDSLAQVAISTGATTNKGLVIQGVASQTADILQIQDSTGAAVFSVYGDGGGIGTNTVYANYVSNQSTGNNALIQPSATGTVITTAVAGNVALTLQNTHATPTGDLLQVKNTAGGVVTKIDSTGALIGGLTSSGYYLDGINVALTVGTGSYGGATITAQNPSAGRVGGIFRGAAAQTADLLQFQDSSSAVLSGVGATGNLFIGATSGANKLNVNTPYTAVTGADAVFTATDANTIPLVVQVAASPTVNAFQVRSSTGSVAAGISATGRLFVASSAPISTAALSVSTGAAGNIGAIIKANSSQTADLLQLRDNSDLINASFNALGSQLTLGRIAGSGTVTQGKLLFSDGTTDNFGLTLQSATLTANRTITLPNETGTVCTTGSVCTGYAPASGSANYIQNQSASAQTANFYMQSATTNATTALIKAIAGQTNRILDVQDVAGDSILAVGGSSGNVVNVRGALSIYNDINNALSALQVTNALNTTVAAYIKGAVGQSANLLEFQNNSGTPLTVVDASGFVGINTSTIASKLNVNTPVTVDGLAQVAISTGQTIGKGLVTQGVVGQSANLLEAQNSAGTPIAYITASGNVVTEGEFITAYGVRTPDKASGNTLDMSVRSGNATSGNSGNVTIDAGTASGTKGTVSLGAANASAITLGRAGITTTNAGALTVSQLLTGNLGATISGAAISLNDNSNFNTTINTGTSTGTVTVGSANAGAIALQSGTSISLTGVTNINASANNATNINTGTSTGAVTVGNSLAGNISLQSGSSISTIGITNLNASSNFATNINTGTSTGAVSIGNSSDAANAVNISAGSTGLINLQQSTQVTGDITYAAGANRLIKVNNSGAGVAGYNLTVAAGSGGSNSTAGGNVTIQAGSSGGGATGNGGHLTFLSGSANSTNGNGGNITFTAGSHSGSGTAGEIIFRPSAGSTSAEAIQFENGSNINIGAFDTTNGRLVLGTSNAGGVNGQIQFLNSTNSNAITLVSATGGNGALTLPAETGTVCTTGSVCTGYAPASGSANYIQNQSAGQQATSNFWISGTGRADTSVLTPTLDVAAAGTLNIGNTTATAITLGRTGITTTNAGALTVTQLLTGNLGATISGAAISLNTTGTSNTAIGNATGTFQLTSNALNVSTAGALTGVTGITTSGSYTQSGTGANTYTGATDFNMGYGRSTTVTSDLVGGARSIYPMIITQANDAVNNNSVGLLRVVNADTGSTAAVLSVGQVSNGTGIYVGGITGGTILSAGNLTSGTGFNFSGATSGVAVDVGTGNALTSGVGLLYNTTSTEITSGSVVRASGSASGALAAYTGNLIDIQPNRTLTSGSINDSGRALYLNRTNTVNNAGSTYTVSGALASLQSNCVQTAGTCVDSSTILDLGQSYGGSTGAVLNASGAGTGSVAVLTAANTAGTQTDALLVSRNGIGGATTNLVNLTNAAGTATNALTFTGTFTNLINSANFSVTNAGALTSVGVNSGTGLIQGTGGLTAAGAAISLNDNSNFNTTINTGTSTGTVTIGNGTSTAGTIALQGGASSSFSATNATGTTKLAFAAPSTAGTVTFQLPAGGTGATTYDICTTLVVCTGYAPASGSANYIQNQSAGQQATSNFWLSGTGRADTSITTPLLDTATAVVLNIGTTNATQINLNKNVVVAANQSLTISGGAARPGTPVPGMMYYDTTTNQVLQYNGTKWMSDRSSSTKIVAASNSSQAVKDSADYVADGTDDQVQINAALIAAAGGKVYLAEGTYVLHQTNNSDATIFIPNNTTLSGAGQGTVIEMGDIDATDNMIENTDTANGTGITLRDMKLDGRKDLNTVGNIHGIYLSNLGTGNGDSSVRGGTFTGLWVGRFSNGSGFRLNNVDHSVISNNFVFDINASTGIYLSGGNYNTITGNDVHGNGLNGITLTNTSTYNTVSNNMTRANDAYGIGISTSSSDNSITGNSVSANGNRGISIASSNNNVVTGNSIDSNGANTTNEGIYISDSDYTVVSSNRISDTNCTTTCHAIDIADGTSDKTYISGNMLTGGSATYPATINDAGTATIYANQAVTAAQSLQSSSSIIRATASSVITGSIDPDGTTTVTGSGTFFVSQLQVGDRITVSGETRTIVSITDDDTLTVSSAFSDNANDASVDRLPAALLVRNSAGVNVLDVSDIGTVRIKTSTNSSVGFQVQGSTGTDVLTVSTSTNSVYVNGALDTTGAATLSLGTSNATALTLGKAGITTTNAGALTVSQLLTGSLGATISGAAINLNATGTAATTIGNSTGTLALLGGNSTSLVVGTGANTTTLNFTAPSGNNVITFPAEAGTVCLRNSANCGFLTSATSTLQGVYTASVGGTTPEIKLDSTRGAVDIQDADSTINGSLLTVRASNGAGLGNSLFDVNSNGRVGINLGASSATADLSFGSGANRTVNVVANTANAAGYGLTVSAGAAGAGASAYTGGLLTLQGGAAAGTGNANGGNVTIAGGVGVGTGTTGNIILGTGDGTTPTATTVRGAAASGTNVAGTDITFDASNGTGYAGSGAFVFRTASGASSAITKDAASSGEINSANQLTYSHVTANQSNRVLVVGVATQKAASPAMTVTSVTYNGVALTKLTNQVGPNSTGYVDAEVWYLVNPPNGTFNVVVNTSATGSIAAGSITLYNVAQTNSITQYTSNQASTANPSLTLSGTNINHYVMSVLANETNATSVGANMTSQWSKTTTNAGSYGASTPGLTGSTTVGWVSGAQNWAQIAFAVNPIGGSSASALTEAFRINQNGNVAIGSLDTAASYNLSFGAIAGVTTARTIGVEVQPTANTGGNGLTVSAGTANGTGTGGTLNLQGGAAGSAATSAGGGVTIQGSNGTTTGSGGNGGGVTLTGGNGTGTGARNGGNIGITAGASSATGSGAAGTISLQGGTANATNTAGGAITITGGTGNGTQAGGAVSIIGGTAGATGTGGALTVRAGTGGGTSGTGGLLTLQGGNAAGGNTNGGNITLIGGAGAGTGVQGIVNLSTTAFTSASVQTFASPGVSAITAGNVDAYSTLPITASVAGVIVTVPDPAQSITGRVIYIAARNGSNDFTIRLNSARTPIDIAMKANSTATLIWNGTDWTAAGASSSTDLQSAYNNTLTSAGGAELILNAPGGNADGLTVRNNSTTPILGGIFEAQTSIGSNLFSVNNNAIEYATNGGAETAGTAANNFPAAQPTWTATSNATVARDTTASNVATGQAAASVDAAASATNRGVINRMSTTLTANLKYTVSYAVKASGSGFSSLETYYSSDGSAYSTQCTHSGTVASSVWTRVSCSFTPTAVGSSNSIIIRVPSSDASARTFYVDNLSVTVSASVNHAVDGSVDAALGTNWVAIGGSVALTGSTIYDTSGAVAATTGVASRGVYNNLSAGISPATSTQYRVAFYARGDGTNSAALAVNYSRDGGSTLTACQDYNTQTAAASTYTLITCFFTTDGTTPTSAQLRITQTGATPATFYVDALSVTLNNNNASNVQIGGGSKGGPTTLMTLDRASSAPIAANNDAYLGSMYYDTTTGRIQCYEADGWGACGSAPDNIVNLNPEYAGAVLNGSGVGTMTTDLCANGGGLSVNTGLCSSGQAKNYYRWTSPQANQQTYSIFVSYQLPATFKGFASDDTVQLTARVDNTTNAAVTYEMFKSDGGSLTQCGTGETDVIGGVANSWRTLGVNGNESTGCSFTASSAGNYVIFKINVKAKSNANAYVSTLSFTTTGN